jgi:hypothetical protein
VRFGAETSGKNGPGATTVAAAAAVQLVDENKSFCVCFLNCFFFLDYLSFLCRRTNTKNKGMYLHFGQFPQFHHGVCFFFFFYFLCFLFFLSRLLSI